MKAKEKRRDADMVIVVDAIEDIAAIDPTAHMTLEEMVEKITPETLHDEVDWGPPVGNEVW